LLGTSMNEMQMETPMVSGGSRDPPPSPWVSDEIVNSKV
jgi:hypothetical protein